MKIFGTIYPFVESDDSSLKLGRYVANYDFLKALLAHSDFDEFHIFCMNASHFKRTSSKLLAENIPNSQKAKVKLFLYNHLISMISQNSYHVFHLGGWGYFFSGLAYIRNKYAKNIFPITGIIHSLNGKETNYHAFKMMYAPLMPYDTIVCSSNAGKMVLEKTFSLIENEIQSRYNGSFEIIPLAIENTEQLDYHQCRKMEQLSDDTIRILTVGRISPITKYDPYPLIIAIADIIRSYPDLNIELIIAGGATGSELYLVKEIISEEKMEQHIKVISNFSDEKKAILYNSSDIYVSLIDNLQETFGISIIEAMNVGLPVVISDINGYKELVEEESTGFKIPSLWHNDFEANELSSIMDFSTLQLMLAQSMSLDLEYFKEKIILLAKDKNLRKKIGDAAQHKVLQNYYWPNVISQYMALWAKLNNQSINSKIKPQTGSDIFENNYIDAFSHYPSSLISEDLEIKITPRGKKVILDNKLPTAYNNIQPLLNHETILSFLKNIENLKHTSSSALNSISHFELLWMSKYGLIHIKKNGENKID